MERAGRVAEDGKRGKREESIREACTVEAEKEDKDEGEDMGQERVLLMSFSQNACRCLFG